MPDRTVISTFAGCGGSSLGYKLAGCKVLAAVEWEPHACECYRLNHPDTQVFQRDIATVSGTELLEATGLAYGELDILDGSPPCQGFSTAGKRVLDDPRNSLFRQHLRLVDELGPVNVVIENVSGMVKGKMKAVAGEIVLSLKERGYQVTAGLLDAQYFGVPQRRLRTVFIGSKLGKPALPRPTSRPIPCGVALMGVEPDEWLWPKTNLQRFVSSCVAPGLSGADVATQEGKPSRYFGHHKINPLSICPTITKTCFGQATIFHWSGRHISIREALVLTGFPPDFILPGKFNDRWARIGNSVAPPMAREVALQSILPLYGAAHA